MSSYTIISESVIEPISLEDAKQFLRIDGTDDDDLVYSMIKVARQMCENKTWLVINPSVIRMNFDKEEVTEYMRINKLPVREIDGVFYKDANGVQQTLLASKYEVDLYSNPVRIRILEMPNIGDYMNAFSVEYKAGYSSGANVPKPIIQAMKMIMGHLNENRQDVVVGSSITKMPNGSEYLLEPYIQPAYYL
jgi:uncharacterized phiE125 gp8 family phage protein